MSISPTRCDRCPALQASVFGGGNERHRHDPRGIVLKNDYDNLGRPTKTIEAYTNGTPTSNTNKTTEFTYDGSDNLLTLKALLTGGAYQKTEFVYGVTTSTSD